MSADRPAENNPNTSKKCKTKMSAQAQNFLRKSSRSPWKKNYLKIVHIIVQKNLTQGQPIPSIFLINKYRGFLPNATFGPWEETHQPNFALAQYLVIYFITEIIQILGYLFH